MTAREMTVPLGGEGEIEVHLAPTTETLEGEVAVEVDGPSNVEGNSLGSPVRWDPPGSESTLSFGFRVTKALRPRFLRFTVRVSSGAGSLEVPGFVQFER